MLTEHEFARAFRCVLSDPKVTPEQIELFRDVLRDEPQRVVRNVYQVEDRGCILYWLVGATTRQERVQFFDQRPTGPASQLVVEGWDAGVMTHTQLAAEIDAFLAEQGRLPMGDRTPVSPADSPSHDVSSNLAELRNLAVAS